tara:strand:+ start:5206 stop:5631 length:426 start_codon:yes stop_codon:yes gene_type:complete
LNQSSLEAVASFERWALAFNTRNADAMIAEMHFPHIRLAGKEFQTWVTAEDFRSAQDQMTKMLLDEGWHVTITKSVTAVQSSIHKVHLVIRQSRQRKDGTEYNGFDTMWVFTKIEGKWGVQFRSSFLANAVHGVGAMTPKF